MNRTSCPQEEAVRKAAGAGKLPESVANHAFTCAVCRDVVQTSRWMQSLAQSDVQGSTLPDAKLVWWNAQLADRRSATEKKRRLLEGLEIITGAGAPILLAGWVAWNWYGIEALATQLLASQLPQFVEAEYALASLAPALLLLGALFLAYPLLIRE